ncbi:hypothetical protein TNCT_623251 [Trichonephila clavata]|uniref:Uncharacterized protein n=1 Tax=Trichonephila clavata TaxID=2740835 RepID=A0A8X6HBZ5_TRICU|nr:hypothetical protein TNCT_623251 [Trichonephila clavata]
MDPACEQGTVQAGGGSVDDLESFSITMRHPTCPELLQSGCRSTLLSLDTSADHQIPDMNVIEYIWDALQRAVQQRSPLLTSTDLRTTLKDS